MVSLKDASSIIQKKMPSYRIIGCVETEDYYAFNMAPRRWNGSGDPPCSGVVNCVNKITGEFKGFGALEFGEIELKDYPKWPQKVDILEYLSKEDSEFLKNVNSVTN